MTRLLLVEDNEENREGLSRHLKRRVWSRQGSAPVKIVFSRS